MMGVGAGGASVEEIVAEGRLGHHDSLVRSGENMGGEDIDVLLIEAAAARGCDQCGGHFHDGRITIRGDEVLSVVCRSCVDGGVAMSRTLH
nr:hypothetical protein TQ38_26080 [Novosphingobium sp. P6W]KIS29847.1 hypothetical protein TQ38_26150 [Novosphingobium sp. P6W]